MYFWDTPRHSFGALVAAVVALAALLALVVTLLTSSPVRAQTADVAIRSSCLAQNGRIDVDLPVDEQLNQSYVVAVSGLAPRPRTVAPAEELSVGITGRADGVYQVLVERASGTELKTQEVKVECDPADPTVDLGVSCLRGRGRIDVAVTNTAEVADDYTISMTAISQRVRTVSAGQRLTVPYTGRVDGRYTIAVANSQGRVFVGAVHVGCDSPLVRVASVAVDCLAEDGRVEVTIANRALVARTFGVVLGSLPERQVTLNPDSVGNLIFTGRADGLYTLFVSDVGTGESVRTIAFQVRCDRVVPTPVPVATIAPTATPFAGPTPFPVPPPRPASTDRMGAIGDFGGGFNSAELQVSNLIDILNPDLVFTVGDNVYSGDNEDAWAALDRKVGQYYHQWIYPYNGQYGAGSPTGENRFFPALGNHDWGSPGTPLLSCSDESRTCSGAWFDFFSLPNNERYYVVEGDAIDVFIVDDWYLEPDGHEADSDQARWLRDRLAASDAQWKMVVTHYPPYVDGDGGQPSIRWPFKEWGADVVMSGHTHTYERLQRNGLTFFINGIGGVSLDGLPRPTAWTRTQFNQQHGAMLVEATDDQLTMELLDINQRLIDWAIEYKVAEGDTAASLAARFNVAESVIRDLNPDVNFGSLAPGQTISIARQ